MLLLQPFESAVDVCMARSVVQLAFVSPIVAADCSGCLDLIRNGEKSNDGLSTCAWGDMHSLLSM